MKSQNYTSKEEQLIKGEVICINTLSNINPDTNNQDYSDLLKYAITNGIISTSAMAKLQNDVDMTKRQKYLDMHQNKIYQGKDGRWYTRMPKEGGGTKQKVFRSREEAENAVISFYAQIDKNPTIKEVFNEYQDERLERKKIVSSTYQRNKMIFNQFYKEFGNKRIRDITVRDIADFIEDSVFKMNLTSAGYKKIKGVMISVLKYGVRKGYINYTFDAVKPFLDINQKDLAEDQMSDDTEVYSEEETVKLRNYLNNSTMIHDLALLLFLLTGLRNGELTALKWEDYNGESLLVHRMERTEYNINGEKSFVILDEHAKTKKGIREVPLVPAAINVLERIRKLNPDGTFIFEDEMHRRITSENLRKRLVIVCQKIGIKYRPPHKIRKTFITILLDGGMSPTLVSDIVGHRNPATTLQYYKYKRASNQTIIDKYDPIFTSIT